MEFFYHETDNNVLILAADGGLNRQTADQFIAELQRLVDAGLRRIVVDCSKLDYVSSYGLGVLMRIHKRMAEAGGEVKLARVGGAVAQLLHAMQLNRIFEMYPDVDQARLAFRPPDTASQT
jgi:anti-anti-sigma factor